MSQEVSMRGNRRSYPRRILLIIGGVLWMSGASWHRQGNVLHRERELLNHNERHYGDGDTLRSVAPA